MKNIKSILPFLVIGLVIACIVESCKTTQKAIARDVVVYKPLYLTKTIHDTVKVPRKQMTQEQFEAYLSTQYRYNFNTLFAPEFKKLSSVIGSQAKSIESQSKSLENLTTTVNEMRSRSIRMRDSLQRQINSQNSRILAFQSKSLANNEVTIEQNSRQLKEINTVTDYMLIGWAIMFMLLIILGIIVVGLYRRTNKVFKSIQHV